MKMPLILSMAVIFAPGLAGAANPLKTCTTTLQMPGEPAVYSVFEIDRKGAGYVAKVTQTKNGQTGSYEDVAEVAELSVQPGLSGNSNPDTLNRAEALVVHAMATMAIPELHGFFDAGLDLTKVRSAKVYTIGKPTNMGVAAIVEAKDAQGLDLGSYLGGFLVSPCKP